MKTRTFLQMIWMLSLMLMPKSAIALDINGQGDTTGIALLYRFQETSGDVIDSSGVGTPLNLKIKDDRPNQSILRSPGSLQLLGDNVIYSTTPVQGSVNTSGSIDNPGKLDTCITNNEFTIEMWIRNSVFDPSRDTAPTDNLAAQPTRIITFSNNTKDFNMFVGQFYDGNSHYAAAVRTDRFATNSNTRDNLISTDENILSPQQKDGANTLGFVQHVYLTKSRDGHQRLYVSDKLGRTILREQKLSAGSISNWTRASTSPQMYLALGNEWITSGLVPNSPNYFNEAVPDGSQTRQRDNQNRPWRGTYHMVAVYCRALTEAEILGSDKLSNKITFQNFPVDLSDEVGPNRVKAQFLYNRITGVKTPIDNPKLKEMEQKISAGDMLGAARVATGESSFYNITVRDFAARMSTREEVITAPLSDFVATIVGVAFFGAQDGLNAKDLLTGNFTYQADLTKAAVSGDPIDDILLSNRHYLDLAKDNYDLTKVLVKVDGQKVYDPIRRIATSHPDPSGLITSRSFMEAHAVAGTNRRLVEYAFREFLCTPITEWSDNLGPDNFIGKDVDRAPGGDFDKFRITCRGCHSMLDPLRPAFARFTFSSGYVKYSTLTRAITSTANAEGMDEMKQMPAFVASKFNHNANIFPGGYEVADDRWTNNAIRGRNATQFGWGNKLNGTGVREFGEMLAGSKAFPRCMAKRAYRSLCKREAQDFESEMIERAANDFVTNNYSLRRLFEYVAVTPECTGQ